MSGFHQSTPLPQPPVPSRWERFLPIWEQPSVVVLEAASDLAAALGAELLLRRQRLDGPLSAVHATAAGPNHQGLICLSARTSSQVLLRLRERPVVAVVLDLNSHSREALGLLRQLQNGAATAAIAAIGDQRHDELTSLLFEAGCSLVLTRLPHDVELANWIERVISQTTLAP